jgi:hypothetical protein
MLPSPQTSEDVLAPTSFQRGGAEFSIVRATAIWRKSQKHRGVVVLMRAAWIALVRQRSVVGCLVFALLAPPSFLLPMTASCAKSHRHLYRTHYSTGRCHMARRY